MLSCCMTLKFLVNLALVFFCEIPLLCYWLWFIISSEHSMRNTLPSACNKYKIYENYHWESIPAYMYVRYRPSLAFTWRRERTWRLERSNLAAPALPSSPDSVLRHECRQNVCYEWVDDVKTLNWLRTIESAVYLLTSPIYCTIRMLIFAKEIAAWMKMLSLWLQNVAKWCVQYIVLCLRLVIRLSKWLFPFTQFYLRACANIYYVKGQSSGGRARHSLSCEFVARWNWVKTRWRHE